MKERKKERKKEYLYTAYRFLSAKETDIQSATMDATKILFISPLINNIV